jgi:RNA polymerase sigma-70 factor (ECF subfamily)
LYACRFVDDKEACGDIVSDVFTSLWERFDTPDLLSETILAYIKMSVKNRCLDYLKHQAYEWDYEEKLRQHIPAYETEPDSLYTLDELYEQLYNTLTQLPENYRTVFVKNFFGGKSYAEIADEMNLSVKSICRYKQKTVELLRKKLGE